MTGISRFVLPAFTEATFTKPRMNIAKLLAIVAVDPSHRILCQNPGCGHTVYAAIHVVDDAGTLLVLGSTCFAKRYGGSMSLGAPAYSAAGTGGERLTEEERRILIENTAELMARFKDRHEEVIAKAKAKLKAMRDRLQGISELNTTAPIPQRLTAVQSRPKHPWPWQKAGTSLAVVRAPEGQTWVRVQHEDGKQTLAPWPVFEGWDESFPPLVGTPSEELHAYRVNDIAFSLQWLRSRGYSAPEVSRWPEVLAILQKQ